MSFRNVCLIAACAAVTSVAQAAKYELIDGLVSSTVPSSFFDMVTVRAMPDGFYELSLTKTVGSTPISSFTLALEKSFRSASFTVTETADIPQYSILFSYPQHSLGWSAQGAYDAYIGPNRGAGNFNPDPSTATSLTVSSSGVAGGMGLMPSSDPTCASFTCMVPFQTTGTLTISFAIQSAVPEPETGILALAAAGILGVGMRRKQGTKSLSVSGIA